MEFFTELNQLLANTQQTDGNVRKQAENEIRRLRDTDPRKFLATLTKEVADESNPETVRMLGAVVFKNFIANRGSDQRYQDYWVNLDQIFKENIKQAMLANLASHSSVVRKQVGSAIAAIASIEIPRKEWLELIPNLCDNSVHEQFEIRSAALETLGFICEELMPEDLIDELKNKIVLALTTNINPDPQFQKTTLLAVRAFFQALPYASQNFKVQQERDFIMTKLFGAFQSTDEEIQTVAMQTLVEIARQEYESVEFYFVQICQITADAAKGADEKVGAQGIEFWTSLAEEETNRLKKNAHVKGYIAQCSSDLISLLLDCIQRVNIEDEDEEDEELGVALSSGCCLAAVALVIGSNIIQPVIEFVSNNILHQEWKKRYSALLALGAITEGPEKMKFMNVIIPGLNNLIAMFQDPHAKVREAIAWVMSKICEHHSDVIVNNQSLSTLMPIFMNSIKDKPRISNQICRAIENLATSTASSYQNPLAPYFHGFFNLLIENAYRTDYEGTSSDLALASFTALSALCESSGSESIDVLYSMLIPILQLIEQTLDTSKLGDSKTKDLQDYLAGLLQIILVKVGQKVDDITASNIVKLLVLIFQNLKKVTENGLIAFSGLINGIGERVNVDDFGQYIVWALKGEDDECTRLACGLVSDLAGALKGRITKYLLDFVPPLLQILKDQNQDRNSKLQAIVALGDLAMNAGENFTTQYLNDVLKILESASKLSLQKVKEEDDSDLFAYLIQLRETLVECYTTIVHGVNQEQTKKQLVSYAPTIFMFLQQLVNRDMNPSKDQIKNILGLIGDIAHCIGNQILDLLRQQFVEQMIIAMRNEPDQESKEIAQWAFEQITNSLK